jgi:hypothetical protein
MWHTAPHRPTTLARPATPSSTRNLPGDPDQRDNWACEDLAAFANGVMKDQADVHRRLGSVAAFIVRTSAAQMTVGRGVQDVAATVAGRIVENLPLPTDVGSAAVARVVRVAGVFLCTPSHLRNCRCLADLALSLLPDQLRKVLEHGFDLSEPDPAA